MSTLDRAEISRRNGQKSMGPKTIEGKNRSRLNAVKHGMTSTLSVMPGEDGEVLQGRIDAWTDDLRPRSLLESHFIEEAAKISWQLERIERAYVARLTTNVLNAEAEETLDSKDYVDSLGERLFGDRLGPIQLYPNVVFRNETTPRTSCSGFPNDPDNPVRLIRQLESTVAGCEWLLARWAELKTRLEPGKSWHSPDKLRAIRLLGKQPLDAADDADVATIFIACHVIDPQFPSAFYEIKGDADGADWKRYQKRLENRGVEQPCPKDESEAREVLLRIVNRATARLDEKAEACRKRAEIDAGLATDRLSFDDSPEAERLRRYQTTCSRGLHKAIDAIVKLRLVAKDRDSQTENECEPIAAIEVDPESPLVQSPVTELIDHPIVSTTPVVTQTEIVARTTAPDANAQDPCEPMTVVENSILRNEPSPIIEPPVLRNEPSPAVEPPLLRNEPSPIVELPILQSKAQSWDSIDGRKFDIESHDPQHASWRPSPDLLRACFRRSLDRGRAEPSPDSSSRRSPPQRPRPTPRSRRRVPP